MANITVTESEVKLGPYRADFHITALSDGCKFEHLHPVPPRVSCSRIPFSLPGSPLAILMSRAVRIRAISVEVKWTVMSSATGIFIRTNLCAKERKETAGGKKNIERNLGEKRREVQGSNAETKKKGKDSLSPVPPPLSASHLRLTRCYVVSFFLGNVTEFQKKGD